MNGRRSEGPGPRGRRIAAAAVFLAVACGTIFYSAGTKKPVGNTEEYRAAHGVVHGRTNDIRVRGVLFRFPSVYLPEPETAGRIVRGQADTVLLHADLSSLIVPALESRSEGNGLVRIEIRTQGFEDVLRKRKRLATGPNWKDTRFRADLGLREYAERGDHGGWGYLVYASDDPAWRTPMGGPIVFDCVGLRDQEPSQCRTTYQHPRGPLVWYYLSRALLPRWREVHADVVRRVDSFIVE